MIKRDTKIYIAGHTGLAGSAILRALVRRGYENIVVKTHSELELTDQRAVREFFSKERPEAVIIAAAKVGGIIANMKYPGDFIYVNLAIALNVIHEAWRHGVERLIFLGSSCIYPRNSPQPMREEYWMTGQLEPTNRAYAIAKIAGIEMCWAYNRQYGTKYIALLPTNLYGVGDNYHPENSHVIPGLIRRFHEAKIQGKKEVVIWGTGTPRREFLFSDDLGEACAFCLEASDEVLESIVNNDKLPPILNVGSGEEVTIAELAEMIAEVVGFQGRLVFDSSKPDGMPRKLLDSSRIYNLGWRPKTTLKEGLPIVYKDFLEREGKK